MAKVAAGGKDVEEFKGHSEPSVSPSKNADKQ
jgi:hypothetical protein